MKGSHSSLRLSSSSALVFYPFIVNNPAMSTEVQVSAQHSNLFFGFITELELVDYDNPILNCFQNLHTIFSQSLTTQIFQKRVVTYCATQHMLLLLLS